MQRSLLLYLDNCVWQRFYECNLPKEAKEAIEKLLQLRKEGKVRIARGGANEDELMATSNTMPKEKRDEILKFIRENTDDELPTHHLEKCETDEKLIDLAGGTKGKYIAGYSHNGAEDLIKNLEKQGVKHDDAVHLATAVEADVNIFVTVDESLLKKAGKIKDKSLLTIPATHPKAKLRKCLNASPTSAMKILSPDDTLQRV